MIQTVDKWQVTITFDIADEITLYLHDNYYENMLKKLSEIGFGKMPISIHIRKMEYPENSISTSR